MAKKEGLDPVEAHRLIEEQEGLTLGSLSTLLRWLPVVQAIQATAQALTNQAVGERVEIPSVKGIRIGDRIEEFDGAGFTRRK
jgi:hypothetical protein